MTYIEFFDRTASENVSACLTFVPDRVIYIGREEDLMHRHKSNYEKVFTKRGHAIEFSVKPIKPDDLNDAVRVLSEIVNEYDDCVFDVTGGEELLNLALGIVYAKNPDKKFQIHKFNIRNNIVYDCDQDGVTIFKDVPKLSIEENVRIYGGDVVFGDADNQDATYRWDMTPDFLNDVAVMWNYCKTNPRFWNSQINTFEAIDKVGKKTEDGLTVVAKLGSVTNQLARDKKGKYVITKGLVNFLLKNKLISCFVEDEKSVTITYKNQQVKRCLIKSGQVLEMKVFSAVDKLCKQNGIYNDALNGVVIDWDGELHNEKIEKTHDTKNEIDVMLMHNIVPVFISCKNGEVTSDELYKLNTVAERFGGPYAKKVLVVSAFEELGESGEYLRQRARDMNIKLIKDFKNLDDNKFENKFKRLWCN